MTTQNITADPQVDQCAGRDTASYKLLGRLRLAQRLASHDREPVLAPAALHGLAGEIVRRLEPITEATPAAMLVTLLVTFSAMVGRTAHVFVGPQAHYPILFGLVVGDSARARKGTSMAAVRPILEAADRSAESFMRTRQLRGIQSGEALIQAAAEAGEARVSLRPDLFDTSRAENQDQRLLVVEEEYARLLTIAGRQNSTLTTVLRSAWDGDQLVNKTRRETLVADQAHICVLAHVTREELRVKLSDTDVANGYANRFLHVFSRRTQLLPNPGRLPEETVQAFGARLRATVQAARAAGEVIRTDAFQEAWAPLYYLVESQPSGGTIYDAMTPRGPIYMLRLAMVYALLDGSRELRAEHLEAASALWDYCEATVAHVWGVTFGTTALDKLWKALVAAGPAGLGRSEINQVFARNITGEAIDAMTRTLVDGGLASQQTIPTGGRPRTALIAHQP